MTRRSEPPASPWKGKEKLTGLSGDSSHRFRWLVLYTRPRYEKKVHARLEELSITAYLPLREEVHQWSDRRKLVEMPLFSGYVFVHVDERARITALELDGAMKYVSFGGKIAEVSERTIRSLRLMMTRSEDVRVEETALRLGQKVRVLRGPLAGLRGYLVSIRSSTRVAITVEGINRVVSVEVPVGDLAMATREIDS